jgi:hypothetical protein
MHQSHSIRLQEEETTNGEKGVFVITREAPEISFSMRISHAPISIFFVISSKSKKISF